MMGQDEEEGGADEPTGGLLGVGNDGGWLLC